MEGGREEKEKEGKGKERKKNPQGVYVLQIHSPQDD